MQAEPVSDEKYMLCCPVCGREYPDNGYRSACDGEHDAALLRSNYLQKKFTFSPDMPGIFKFAGWLPGPCNFNNSSSPVTYRSEKFAGRLGLENLYISFNGYWPERGASMLSCSFKELEAAASISRYLKGSRGILVVASAGNTARAFAELCTLQKIPLLLIVPESARKNLWLTRQSGNTVNLLTLKDLDFSDVIEIANRVCASYGFINEGGARNIARRDGMGTVLLDYLLCTGSLPDHYFQAVGSGTGAISVWEANLRILEDGSFGGKKVKLHLSQNYPFCPIYDAWKMGVRNPLLMDRNDALNKLKQVEASVLSNRLPPYGLAGGVYDALTDSGGEVYSVTNSELHKAKQAFETQEGIDICSAAAVSVASLIQAAALNKIGKKDSVLLNITEGGAGRIRNNYLIQYIKPALVVENPLGNAMCEYLKNMARRI